MIVVLVPMAPSGLALAVVTAVAAVAVVPIVVVVVVVVIATGGRRRLSGRLRDHRRRRRGCDGPLRR
jgi:Flp pilus assembly protein TadB